MDFETNNELDFSYSIAGVGRFRVNIGRQRGTLALAFRLIPFSVPTIDDLGLPPILKELIMIAPRPHHRVRPHRFG